MLLYADNTGKEENRPSTEELLGRYCIDTTINTLETQMVRFFPHGSIPQTEPERTNFLLEYGVQVLEQCENHQTNRSTVRKGIIPVLDSIQTRLNDIVGTSGRPRLFRGPMEEGELVGKPTILAGAEMDRILTANFPTLRHFIAEVRECLFHVMALGVTQVQGNYPDQAALLELGTIIAQRPGLEEKDPKQALRAVLMASFSTPVSFYLNAINAMFERSFLQHAKPLSEEGIDSLLRGEHEIVDAITRLSMGNFKPIESAVRKGETLPADLAHTFGAEEQKNLWNPNLVWLSGKPGASDQRLEFSERLFQEAKFGFSYESVMCSGRGKLMEWFQNLLA